MTTPEVDPKLIRQLVNAKIAELERKTAAQESPVAAAVAPPASVTMTDDEHLEEALRRSQADVSGAASGFSESEMQEVMRLSREAGGNSSVVDSTEMDEGLLRSLEDQGNGGGDAVAAAASSSQDSRRRGTLRGENGTIRYDGELRTRELRNRQKRQEKHGQGKLFRPDGTLEYEGWFKNDEKDGRGIVYGEDGKVVKYEGEFRAGLNHGNGIRNYHTGRKYEGEFQDGKRHGWGTYTWADGRKYIGEFQDGYSHGHGRLFGSSGTLRYEGEYKFDKRNGRGKLYEMHGAALLYEGNFVDHKPEDAPAAPAAPESLHPAAAATAIASSGASDGASMSAGGRDLQQSNSAALRGAERERSAPAEPPAAPVAAAAAVSAGESTNGVSFPEPPTDYICPITQELFEDPVLASDGETYERSAIEQWFAQRAGSPVFSPVTGAPIHDRTLFPNNRIRALVNDFRTTGQQTTGASMS